jgi:hypothetical protein
MMNTEDTDHERAKGAPSLSWPQSVSKTLQKSTHPPISLHLGANFHLLCSPLAGERTQPGKLTNQILPSSLASFFASLTYSKLHQQHH